MLFNSFDFLVFFALVVSLYFGLPHRWRWVLILTASCGFYMAFIPVYIVILAVAIVIDFYAGVWIEDSLDPKRKKLWLWASILSVTIILFIFKYFNFFNGNAAQLASFLGWNYPIAALEVILPIGLSFHTFQSLSYVIEVYRGHQKAERHFGYYALYVMYFPQLVAGPIERPQNLLPQLHKPHTLNSADVRDGLALALWGLFKKVVVADTVCLYVDAVYDHSGLHSGPTLLLATYCFTLQIYCDFSGYSDIARGVSQVMGVRLMKNFETPYHSTSIREFWGRWHISLSTWFRDYVYIPLGGNRVSLRRNMLNQFMVFLISGLWHGANWTFVAWGALHGTYLTIERLLGMARKQLGIPAITDLPRALRGAELTVRWFVTFHLAVLAWVFFRAKDVTTAAQIVWQIMSANGSLFLDPMLGQIGVVAVLGVGLDIMQRRARLFDHPEDVAPWFRISHAVALLFGIALLGVDGANQFIYFQF
jgi:alginate O-acetyltransferase complex protein AlgI